MWPRLTILLPLLAFSTASGQQTARTNPLDSVRRDAPALSLVLNIPAYRLDLFTGDSLLRSMRVAIGMRRYPTPRGDYSIGAIEWNPWWIPPSSPWAAKEKTMPPGGANPMGRVKIDFRALYFLHGTPFPASIGTAASHGCIRLTNTNALALARIVARYGSPNLDSTDIARFEKPSQQSTRVALDQPIPIALRYERVEIRYGSVLIHPDVYRLSAAMTEDSIGAVVFRAGLDSSRVDQARARALIRRARESVARMSLDSLLARP